jgi:hypothetical protein
MTGTLKTRMADFDGRLAAGGRGASGRKACR